MILIALGANVPSRVGAPEQTIAAAHAELARCGAPPDIVSPLYRNPAWPDPTDPPFVNAVASLDTARDPESLMALLHELEQAFGRVRLQANAPRTLDLDLLDYHGLVQAGPPVLPHPRMSDRAFVLQPLADIAPCWRHPVSGQSVAALLAALPAGARSLSKLG